MTPITGVADGHNSIHTLTSKGLKTSVKKHHTYKKDILACV